MARFERAMSKHKITPRHIADHIRRVLKDGGSAPHAEGVQHFFKEEIQSRGWRTGEMRKVATRFRRAISKEMGIGFLIQVADRLFRGRVLEEKIFAVLMLEKCISECSDRDFELFVGWLDRVSTWADHDGLVHSLIAPLLVAKPARKAKPFLWAKSESRWHRRAACVAFIQGTRKQMFFPEIVRLANFLLEDDDDMVQKGLGWLLRETAKADPSRTVPYLIKIRRRAPRLVLRTACETLTAAQRSAILGARKK